MLSLMMLYVSVTCSLCRVSLKNSRNTVRVEVNRKQYRTRIILTFPYLLCLSVSLSVSLSLSLCLSFSHSLIISLYLYLTLSLSHSISISLSHFLTLSLSHSLIISLSLFQHSLSLPFSLSQIHFTFLRFPLLRSLNDSLY